jgi:hypothetical protein
MVGWIFLQVFACDGVGCVIDSVVWECVEWQVLFIFLSKFFGRGYVYNMVGCSVIPIACAQILEVKCSNQPNVDGRGCHRYSLVSTV